MKIQLICTQNRKGNFEILRVCRVTKKQSIIEASKIFQEMEFNSGVKTKSFYMFFISGKLELAKIDTHELSR